jgi:hydroxymethylbilane synthase
MSVSPPRIRLGTRGSQLAMVQSRWVKSQLEAFGAEVELVMIRTEGDDTHRSLTQIGGQGVFTKALQAGLLEKRIDLAVHSLKDLPTLSVPGLKIAAVPPREDPADVWVSREGALCRSAESGSRVGTGSLRRAAQLRRLCPAVSVVDIRGNVDTRLRKLDEAEFDALVLAAAGLHRLGLAERITEYFPTDVMFPAVGQGALGLEIRESDRDVEPWVAKLNDPASFYAVMAERAMLQGLNAGCLSAVGAECKIEGSQLQLKAIVLDLEGRQAIQAFRHSAPESYLELGRRTAEALLKQGAAEILSASSS